ncbi:MAG: LIC12162 family transferase [Ilumatobacteraceae bacterium]
MTQKHLVTGPFPELWRDNTSVVVIDGIGLDGKVFVDDPSVTVTLVKSPEILSQVDDAEFAEFQSISESVFQDLVRELNRVHGTDHPVRFWRIVCGAWFLQFAQVWYLRWKVAGEVFREHGALPCRRIDVSWQDLLPVTHDEASLLFATDIWNHIAYCDAFDFVAKSNFGQQRIDSPQRNRELSEYRTLINFGLPSQSAKSKLEAVLAKISPRPKVVLAGVVQSRAALVAMHLRLGILPRLWRFSAKLTPQPINESLRDQINLSLGSTGGFAEFLAKSVSRHLPTVYLEGFKNLTEQTFSENILTKPPRAIFTNTLLHRSEQFKLWSATFVAQGKTKLFSGQHGGGYGVSRFVGWSEEYELAVVDKFLSWARVSDRKNTEACCVQVQLEEPTPANDGNLLVVLGPVTRNSDIYGMLVVQSNSNYFKLLADFVRALPNHVLTQTLVRPKNASVTRKPARVGADQILNIFDRNIEIDFGGQSLNQRLAKSRLAVVTYNETTIPTNLMANFPTVALWDPNYVRLNDRAAAVYEELLKAKILFHSPTDAAKHISAIWSDVDSWWNSEIVQTARLNFCEHYAYKVRFPALTVASVIADNL